MNREGFWFSIAEPDLPMPVSSSERVPDYFIHQYETVVNSDIRSRLLKYKGHSHCRLCNNLRNGSSEYVLKYNNLIYNVPCGFIHYMTEHNVHPSDNFKRFINDAFQHINKIDGSSN